MRLVTKAWMLYLDTVALALILLSVPLVAEAQAGKVYRVGVLLSTSQSFESRRIKAFRQGLREHVRDDQAREQAPEVIRRTVEAKPQRSGTRRRSNSRRLLF